MNDESMDFQLMYEMREDSLTLPYHTIEFVKHFIDDCPTCIYTCIRQLKEQL